jgi:hypothetical protein
MFYIEDIDITSTGYKLGGEFMFIIVKVDEELVKTIELNST